MQDDKFYSVLCKDDISLSECVVSLLHKPKTKDQEDVNDEHAYLFTEQYMPDGKVRLIKFDLKINYDVSFVIVKDPKYVSTLKEVRETANLWSENRLVVRIIINADTHACHFFSAENSIKWDLPVCDIGEVKLRDAVLKGVSARRNNQAHEVKKWKMAVGSLYTTYSGHFFSAFVCLDSEEGDYLEAAELHSKLCDGHDFEGKTWKLPAAVLSELEKLMSHAKNKHFDYNLLGAESIFSKIVDRALDSFEDSAEACSNTCVMGMGKVFGEGAAEMTRLVLAPSGHNCISLVIDILKTAINTYIKWVGKPNPTCLLVLKELSGAAQYFATVTTHVLKSGNDVCKKFGC